MRKYWNKLGFFLSDLVNRFLEVSFQRTEDRLMRKNK